MSNLEDYLVSFGDNVKFTSDGRVKGYLVRFGNKNDHDLEGDYFTSNTNFGRPLDGKFPLNLYYNHGQDETIGVKQIGTGYVKLDEYGLWYEAQIDMSEKYNQMIAKLAKEGRLGYSSGAASHLVSRKQVSNNVYEILQWNLAEASLTPRPAESRNMVKNLKELMEENKEAGYCPMCKSEYDGMECKRCGYKPVKEMEDEMEEPLNPSDIFGDIQTELILEGIETLSERLTEAVRLHLESPELVDINKLFYDFGTYSIDLINNLSADVDMGKELKYYYSKLPHRPADVRDAEKTLREAMRLSRSESKKLAKVLWNSLCDAESEEIKQTEIVDEIETKSDEIEIVETKSIDKQMLLKKAMTTILELKHG